MTIDMEYYRKINGLFGTTNKKDYLQKQAIKSVNKINDSVLSTFEILINSNYAENIISDGISTKCIFDYSKTSQDTKTELAFYTKEMWIEVGIVSVGSVMKHTDKVSLIENTYIVVSKQEYIDGYDVCYIQKSNNTLQFYSSTSTLHQIPCIISKGSISLDEQKIISTLDSEIAVQISDTSITRQIEMNYVFKIGMRNYTVVNIDDITVSGLLLIKMVYSEVEQVFPSYSLTILNGDSIQVNENDPLTINTQVKIDGIIVSTLPNLIFSSSDITKATINSSTGVVTILDVGNVVFSCRMANDSTVMDTISVEIVSDVVDNYTLKVDGSISVIKTYTSTYTCVFRNNGIVVSGVSEFYLTADDGVSATSLASVVSQDGINCVVRGLNLGYVRLFSRSQDGSIVSDGFRIQVKSLF